jgi:hypothetical protein
VSDATPRKPAFAQGFPDDAALNELVEAFVRGDYARVRAEAPKLAESSESDAVKKAARELRARIEPDPLAMGMMIVTGVILLALSLYWIANAHEPHNPQPKPATSAPAPTVSVERVR